MTRTQINGSIAYLNREDETEFISPSDFWARSHQGRYDYLLELEGDTEGADQWLTLVHDAIIYGIKITGGKLTNHNQDLFNNFNNWFNTEKA